MIVCRAAQENGACANYVRILTRTTKSQFSRIHNCELYLMDAKAVVDVLAYQGRMHAKFEENCVNRF